MLYGILTKALTGETSEARQAAASEFAANVKAVGVSALHTEGLLEKIKTSLKAEGKKGANERQGAMETLNALWELFEAAIEPHLLALLPHTLPLVADKERTVAVVAENTLKNFLLKLTPHAFSAVLPYLLDTNANVKWQSLQLQMEVLAAMSKTNMSAQVARCLSDIVPVVSQLMWHSKAQVKQAAISAMESASATMTNKDLEPFLPSLMETILVPESVETCLERLSSTIFVQEVRGDALAIIAPLLMRGLQIQRSTATKRQCARIIDNMSKLVEDPREVQPFVPKLFPALERAKEDVPDPECREVCGKAYEQLMRSSNMKNAKMLSLERPAVLELFKAGAATTTTTISEFDLVSLELATSIVMSLVDLQILDSEQWHMTLTPYLTALSSMPLESEAAGKLLDNVFEKVRASITPKSTLDDDDATEELLCDCNFALAYGSKILLNNARLRLRRGVRYGLVGQNDCGKTSLMRAISRNQVEGFPDPTQVRTVFVETDIQGELSNLSVLDYIYADPLLRNCGVERDEMSKVLMSVGFEKDGPASIDKEVGRLSGGWKMKLALARAMLLKADILLLDEPTNHLDVKNRQWVEEYLQSLTNVTSIMVSHDSGFLDRVCTSILHMHDLKVNQYRGNLGAFVAAVPEAKSYFELQTSAKYRFKFPQPGPLEGINSKSKHIMKMTNVSFTYPTATKAQLLSVSVRVSLSSRVACVGPNGAGKSTMIKLLTGELIPDGVREDGTSSTGSEVWKHPNCRVAYVAQHAFHHIESHLDLTPNEYIRWRYQYGVDKEALKKENMKMTADEMERQKTPIMVDITDAEGTTKKEKRVIKELTNGRRQEYKGKRNEYEVLLIGGTDVKVWLPETQLAQLGFDKAMKEVDERIASMATSYTRPLTSQFVEQHLMDVGLEREFATHTKIKALSGGQKVKVVLAAALWKCPHVIIIDEPTNYLDRESLGALAEAIKEFEGGVVIVSHNNEFCKACCPETWVLENHTLNVQGDPEWLNQNEKIKVAQIDESDLRDAYGNTVVLKKKATRQDMKKLRKRMEQMRKSGEEVYTDEELEKLGLELDPAQA
jgi:elongation factor 3